MNNEELQEVWHLYQQAHGHLPAGTRAAVEWGVQEDLIDLPDVDPLDILAGKMSRALRQETATDAKGRHYRVNQAVRVTKNGTQYSLWGIAGFVPASHSIMSFAQRREQIVGDMVKLSIDVDVHNDAHPAPPEQYMLEYDLTDDVTERRAPENVKAA